MSRVWVRASDARNDPRTRRRELSTNEYETGELGGEEEVEMTGAGGEDPVAVPTGRDKHRRRTRDRRGGEGRIEDGNPEGLPHAAAVPVKIGGVAEKRVGEGEGDEAGRRDAPQPLQLRAHRHRARWSQAVAAPRSQEPIPSRGFLLGVREVISNGEEGGCGLTKERVKRKASAGRRRAAGFEQMRLRRRALAGAG